MIRDEAIAILNLQREEAIATILALAEKAEKYDRLLSQVSPTTPSGMTPVYLKPSHKKPPNCPSIMQGGLLISQPNTEMPSQTMP